MFLGILPTCIRRHSFNDEDPWFKIHGKEFSNPMMKWPLQSLNGILLMFGQA